MSLFSKQLAYCMACGKDHDTEFRTYGGEVCSKECWEELEWRRTLSTLGKQYYPKPLEKNTP